MDDEFTRVRLHDCLESEFPGEWGDPPKCGGNVSVLRSTDIDSAGHVNLATGARRTVPESKLVAKRLKPGDILLEASGGGPGKPVGRVALFPPGTVDAYVCSNFFRTLRPNPTRVDSPYLAWRLQHAYLQPSIWAFQQQTTGIINLKHRDYFAITLELPPLPEQRLIAEILDTVDLAIRKTEAMIAKLGQVKQGLLHDLLTRGIDDNGQLRDPDRHPEQFKDSPLGRIPKEWEVTTLGEIGRPRQWPTISQSKLTSSGYPVFGANGHIGFYTEFNHEEPTVAITCRGATCGNVHLTPPKCYITGNAMALDDVERELVDPRFLAAAVRTRGMADCITGSAQPQIIGSAVRQVSLAVPAISEQRSIVRFLNRIEHRVTAEVATVEKWRDLKSGLMDDLLTGRVRVTNLLQQAAT